MKNVFSGRSILVVEDEMLVLMSIETMLEDLGCTAIAAAASVNEALALIEQQRFDVAMLDVNLDGEKSYAVADSLIGRGIPFVFSTGYGDHNDRTDLADRPVLRKPYLQSKLTLVLGGLMTNQSLPTAA